MDLRHRVVIVTGASSGIGEAVARQCAAEGARLLLVARTLERLTTLEQQLSAGGGEACSVPTDVGSAEQVERMVKRVLDTYGTIDVLINSAGFGTFAPFPEARITDLHAMMQVNVYGTVHCMQAVLPHMLAQQRGQIVNLASVAGLVASKNIAFYNATKFALVGLTRSVQLDLQRSGVQCALICPGPVRTPFFGAGRADIDQLGLAGRLAPWLDPADVARAILAAIRSDSNGEIILPAVVRPLIRLTAALPQLVQWLGRRLGG